MTRRKVGNHLWTKDELKQVIRLWDSKTKMELAAEIGVTKENLNYIATQLRNAGVKLARKSTRGYLQGLIHEAVKELKR